MKFAVRSIAIASLVMCVFSAQAQKGETVKIAYIDPLTGLLGPVGNNGLRGFQFFAEKFNKTNPAGVKFEVVAFDNKLSPAESLNALKAATDQGIRYITQGNGSGVAGAIIEAVNKHNERNPGKEIIFLNYAAVDPDFTNSKCSYWHFRYDADTSMKMEGLTTFMKDRPETKKVFLLNQNYSHGHQVAKFFKEGISRKRPDIQIVGEDLHPLGQVRDFAPYIAKIKASGADSIVTGNWGSDLQLFVKAANEGGFTGNFYTYYTSVTGTPTALGKTGEGRVFQIGNGHARMGGEMDKWQDEYKAKLNDDFYTGQIINIYTTLSEAMAKSKSTDPVKVAAVLSGMKTKSVFNGEIEVRKADHQLQQALFITVWGKVDKKYSYSMENTGMTMIPVKQYPNYISSTPTSCQMKRPA
jgi:branched-chain amino acid transport system substrate-binding protein